MRSAPGISVLDPKREHGSCAQVADRGRDDDFIRTGQALDWSHDVNRDAGDARLDQVDLAGMQPGSDQMIVGEGSLMGAGQPCA